MATSTNLPSTMRALVLPAKGQPLAVNHIPTPQPLPGSIVIKVLAATIDGTLRNHLTGTSWLTFPEPFVPGPRCIGRIAATGPDTTTLTEGQLVLIDPFIRARDDPNIQALFGVYDGPTPTTKAWFANNWRHGSFAEYVAAPLENVHALNEHTLCKTLGYSFADLTFLATQLVAYGGLRSGINLQAGETIIVAPATGSYSGAAVGVAVAMGARVIAASRNIAALKQIQGYFPAGRVEVVQLTNDVETDTARLTAFGPVDAYIDVSPPAAEQTTHVRSCFNALRHYGRASLMGLLQQDVAVPYATAVFKNLTIRAQYMYERDDVCALIKLAEAGLLKVGRDIGCELVGEFALEDIDKAFECALANEKYGQITVLTPHGLS